MKTLAEYNRERAEAHRTDLYPRPTGVACPHCIGGELHLLDSTMLLSSPPKRVATCNKCRKESHLVA